MTNHLIQKQVLDLRFGDVEPDTNPAKKASDAFLSVGIPALQRALDRLAPGDEVLRFERVVIDMGRIGSQSIEHALREDLESVAHEHLAQTVRTGRKNDGPPATSAAPAGRGDASADRAANTGDGRPASESRISTDAVRLSSQQEVIEFAARFLEFGDAPWWSTGRYHGDAKAAVKIGCTIQGAYENNASLREQFFAILKRNPHRTLTRLAGEAWLRPIVDHLRQIGQSLEGEVLVRHRTIARELGHTGPGDSGFFDVVNDETGLDMVLGLIAGANLRQKDHTTAQGDPKLRSMQDADRRPDATGGWAVVESQASPALDEVIVESASLKTESSAQVLYIDDAGIVLLQPFIPLLFEELGLLEDGDFASESSRVKAIRLLEYLAWGTTSRAEFSLRFQKMLCAHPANQPLQAISLREQETQEADRVLDAVIRHWSVLKNTGREGLRSTFLQRGGKIEFGEETRILTVERQTVDVLLSKIPWSYSVMRLPWMAEPLAVRWE